MPVPVVSMPIAVLVSLLWNGLGRWYSEPVIMYQGFYVPSRIFYIAIPLAILLFLGNLTSFYMVIMLIPGSPPMACGVSTEL